MVDIKKKGKILDGPVLWEIFDPSSLAAMRDFVIIFFMGFLLM